MLSCPDCGESLVKKRYNQYVTQLECSSCEKEFDEKGNKPEEDGDPIEIDDLIEAYHDIGGEG